MRTSVTANIKAKNKTKKSCDRDVTPNDYDAVQQRDQSQCRVYTMYEYCIEYCLFSIHNPILSYTIRYYFFCLTHTTVLMKALSLALNAIPWIGNFAGRVRRLQNNKSQSTGCPGSETQQNKQEGGSTSAHTHPVINRSQVGSKCLNLHPPACSMSALSANYSRRNNAVLALSLSLMPSISTTACQLSSELEPYHVSSTSANPSEAKEKSFRNLRLLHQNNNTGLGCLGAQVGITCPRTYPVTYIIKSVFQPLDWCKSPFMYCGPSGPWNTLAHTDNGSHSTGLGYLSAGTQQDEQEEASTSACTGPVIHRSQTGSKRIMLHPHDCYVSSYLRPGTYSPMNDTVFTLGLRITKTARRLIRSELGLSALSGNPVELHESSPHDSDVQLLHQNNGSHCTHSSIDDTASNSETPNPQTPQPFGKGPNRIWAPISTMTARLGRMIMTINRKTIAVFCNTAQRIANFFIMLGNALDSGWDFILEMTGIIITMAATVAFQISFFLFVTSIVSLLLVAVLLLFFSFLSLTLTMSLLATAFSTIGLSIVDVFPMIREEIGQVINWYQLVEPEERLPVIFSAWVTRQFVRLCIAGAFSRCRRGMRPFVIRTLSRTAACFRAARQWNHTMLEFFTNNIAPMLPLHE